MVLLGLSNVKKSFGTNVLFENASFNIEEKDKIGLVGVNGTGKTTLFKAFLGQEDIDEGDIFKSKDTQIGYMQQHTETNTSSTVLQEAMSVFSHMTDMEHRLEVLVHMIDTCTENTDKLIEQQNILTEQFINAGGLTYKSRVKSSLLGLGFNEADLSQPFNSLSGGQKTRVSLCKILLSNSNLLLLDEPTNHLDIASVEWLENFLRDCNKAFVIISHDRYFLDRVTNKTFELENKTLTVYKGAYSRYLELKQEAKEQQQREYDNTQKEIRRLEGIVEQQKRWNREKNIKTAESKQKVIDKLEKTLNKPLDTPDSINFSFKTKLGGGNDVLLAENISMTFNAKNLFNNINFHLSKGERLFLLGSNGCGKTTLFKILTGALNASDGNFKIGANIQLGYYDQTQETLDHNKTVLDEVRDSYPSMTRTDIRNALAAFLFTGDDVFKPINLLSGGEKARVSLVKLMLSGANLLLLDEPTNHLDISSREALEKALMQYAGTLFVISHDRYFINKLASRVMYMTPNGLENYLGNYDYFSEKRSQKLLPDKEFNSKPVINDYKLQKQIESDNRKKQSLITRTETEIVSIEDQISSLNAELLTEECATDYIKATEITTSISELESKLDELYEFLDQIN